VAAVLRRALPVEGESKLRAHGALVMDDARHACSWAGTPLTLTVVEFALLSALLAAPGRVFERAQIVSQAYGHGHYITERTVDSHIRRLRKKLAAVGADPIETVYGVGYRLRETPA
jgi:DNA-binding response OmpR family regulator